MKRQLPKNVRQIGNVSDTSKIYVEDYVDTFFNQLCEKTDQTPVGAFLVGEIVQEKDEDYIYVYGAIQMKEVVQKGRDIFINENTWKNACETCKQYFGDAEILGWFLAAVGQPLDINHNILKVHQKFFSREKSIFVIKEAREKEEKYFIHKFKDLMECGGHYIYYEKNVEMQDYMISTRKKTGMTPSEIIEDTVTKNFRSVIRNKAEKSQQKGRSRLVYAMSTFLILVVLVIGVTMLNNYEKMKGMTSSLDKLNENVTKDDVIETIGDIVQVEGIDDKTAESENPEDTKDEEDVEGSDVTEKPDDALVSDDIENPDDATVSSETENPEGQASPESLPEQSGGQASEQPEQNNVYTVEKGDTLATISKKIYGDITHVDAICELNGLEDGNFILIGQKLLLP